MGVLQSSDVKDRDAAMLKHMAPTLQTLGLTKSEAKRLFHAFNCVDKDASGQVDLHEFWAYLDVDRTTFSERAFSLFDEDGSGEIDFEEYLLSVYNYATHNKNSLITFAFDLYDLDGSGEIDVAEGEQLVMEVWGTKRYKRSYQAQNVLAQLAKLGGETGVISRQQFSRFALSHLSMLFPAYQLQTAMQNKICGKRFWDKVSKRRYQRFAHVDGLRDFLRFVKESNREFSERKTPSPPPSPAKQPRQRRHTVAAPTFTGAVRGDDDESDSDDEPISPLKTTHKSSAAKYRPTNKRRARRASAPTFNSLAGASTMKGGRVAFANSRGRRASAALPPVSPVGNVEGLLRRGGAGQSKAEGFNSYYEQDGSDSSDADGATPVSPVVSRKGRRHSVGGAGRARRLSVGLGSNANPVDLSAMDGEVPRPKNRRHSVGGPLSPISTEPLTVGGARKSKKKKRRASVAHTGRGRSATKERRASVSAGDGAHADRKERKDKKRERRASRARRRSVSPATTRETMMS